MLRYPDFNKPFDIHTDASDVQLGAVISQDNKPIAYYSRKLQPAQRRYTTIERELLSIVETLKEFRNILLGQVIKVHTDHKNLTCTNFNTDRVFRWRLLLEEYGPEIIYIPGEHNTAADALTRLPMADSTSQELFLEPDDLKQSAFPLSFKILEREQNKDVALRDSAHLAAYRVKTFHGGGKSRSLLCLNDKIVVPSTLRRPILTWYHDNLCHPGQIRSEATIRLHFFWPTLRGDVRRYCTK